MNQNSNGNNKDIRGKTTQGQGNGQTPSSRQGQSGTSGTSGTGTGQGNKNPRKAEGSDQQDEYHSKSPNPYSPYYPAADEIILENSRDPESGQTT